MWVTYAKNPDKEKGKLVRQSQILQKVLVQKSHRSLPVPLSPLVSQLTGAMFASRVATFSARVP